MKAVVHVLLTLSLLSAFSAKSQTKDSTVTAIYTDYKLYWTTNTATNNPVMPDSSHNLLAFRFRNGVYSTGVNDATLNAKLGSSNYSAQIFKSFPIKNIDGKVKAGAATNIALALKNDGDSTKAAYKAPYPNIRIADVLTDGKNGLDLGTGVTNLPKGGHISFVIKNLTIKSALDTVPDLVFTQIAEPTYNEPDTIYFADANGNIVGNKKLVYWNSVKRLGTYKLDLYSMTPGMPCNTSIMNATYDQNTTREIRMVAFLLTEFGITNETKVAAVKSIQINPCGSSDQAFIAYNTSTINLDVPVITAQPTSQTLCSAVSTSATFVVTATGTNITYQWKKDGVAIEGATSASYTVSNLALADTASAFSVTVSNAISSITSDNAYVHYLILSQSAQILRIATGNSITLSDSKSSLINGASIMEWQKNGVSISNTLSNYSIPEVTLADGGQYSMKIGYKNITCISSGVYLVPTTILYSKPTGNLSEAATWGVKANGTGNSPLNFNRAEHTFVVLNRDTASTGTDLTIAGTLDIHCTNVTITPGTTLMAASIMRSDLIAVPVDTVFQAEPVILYDTISSSDSFHAHHEQPVLVESVIEQPIILTEQQPIATIDQPITVTEAEPATETKEQPVNNDTIISEVTTTAILDTAIRFRSTGVLSVFPTSNLVVGLENSDTKSSLYFDKVNNTIKNLTVAARSVVLFSRLNIASGKKYGVVQVNYGTLYTSDLLTLKSDSLGTASIDNSAGYIQGRVTVEKWVHARRAWRFMGAPVSGTDAPSINAAWQEGATTSTANPAPGYGTHITGGAEESGFDKSPTNNASLKYYNSEKNIWSSLNNTNKTPVTKYAALMLFVRGNRSYAILSTTGKTTPMTTVLRVQGNLIQGKQEAQSVSASGFTSVVNPYACPINFAKLFNNSRNLKRRIYVWDPTLAGNNGVGAWVIVDGSTASRSFRTTPPSRYVTNVLQAGQGFMVESADGINVGSFQINEELKDLSVTTSGDRVVGSTTDTSLEINLKLFNEDGTTSVADGVLYNFGARNNNATDGMDAVKMYNNGENLSVAENGKELAISSRTAPKTGDSLKLAVYSLKAASYQLEIVPSLVKNIRFALYDKYLNTVSPISATDTTHITFSVINNIAASKAFDRFTIVTEKGSVQPLPMVQSQLIYTAIKATAKKSAVSVEWKVENEPGVLYYQVQKSTDNIHFNTVGTVMGRSKGNYEYTDAAATGNNYYRIMSINKSGNSKYSPVANVQVGNSFTSTGISVYPNPLTGTTFTLTLSSMNAGMYTLAAINSNGISVFTKSITHSGGTASQKITLNSQLPSGIYYIKTTSAEGIITTTKISAK